ncbi:type-F conjugative transfer system pilin assembly protein TraF [Edwardsiella tarda]|uniref:Type-F conjugative transfer system pilin assembly protein TraF n=2 Tax=Edwardsiella tarda TaxID=636 RepID=A0A2A7U858_EDWTA|nr:type-F conjugative transfer system pilin assembly protein TraF [Edwardsiella tarda]
MECAMRVLTLITCLLFIVPVISVAQDAGWQWYNEPKKQRDEERPKKKPAPQPAQALTIMEKLERLQAGTKQALYNAILYPSVPNFVRYFQMQNYWTQQAGLFSMSAKKAMLEHPELDYNLKYSHYNGTVKNQLAADYAQQREAIEKLSQHYGVMVFYRGKEPIDGQLAQVIKNFRENYHLSVIPVTVDGVVSPLLPDTRQDQGQAARLGVRYFPAMMLVDPRAGTVKPLSYGFISQDDLAKQFLHVSTDFKPNF